MTKAHVLKILSAFCHSHGLSLIDNNNKIKLDTNKVHTTKGTPMSNAYDNARLFTKVYECSQKITIDHDLQTISGFEGLKMLNEISKNYTKSNSALFGGFLLSFICD